MFDEEVLAAFAKYNIHINFHNEETISKLLTYKFLVHRELLTVVRPVAVFLCH